MLGKHRRLGYAALVAMVTFLNVALAVDEVVITNADGHSIFRFDYYGISDGAMDYGTIPTWNLSQSKLITDALESAALYFTDILGPGSANNAPAIINVGGISMYNDSASSPILTRDMLVTSDWRYTGHSRLAAQIIDNYVYADPSASERWQDATAYIFIGDWGRSDPETFYGYGPMRHLPDNGDSFPLSSVMFHEIAHALGIMSQFDGTLLPNVPSGEKIRVEFSAPETMSRFAEGLENVNGHQLQGGMKIDPTYDSMVGDTVFGVKIDDPYSSGLLYFRGDTLSEVLDAESSFNNRVKVNAWELHRDQDQNLYWFMEGSHIELDRCLMSHQNYRNYGTFTEAEYAILQDLGFSLDRRNLYGFSVYRDAVQNKAGAETLNIGGESFFVNRNGFSARNAEGTAYIAGALNRTALGVGLHLYGSSNNIVQAADILSGGFSALGVRVDGQNNHLYIPKTTSIVSNGEDGMGVAFAYGKDHRLTHRGMIQALGENGKGVSFDFGSNAMMDTSEYRGSFLRNRYDESISQWIDIPVRLADTEGPLVERFDVTGGIAASADAIYISENAFVGEINIMNGAALYGDIRSLWDPHATGKFQKYFPSGTTADDYITNLTFGRAADADGFSTTGADGDFYLRYDGDILGRDGMRMSIEGGTLEYYGTAEVVDVFNNGGATLAGTASYDVDSFTNDGLLSPGGADLGKMRVILGAGAFTQTTDGVTSIGFNALGGTDTLDITSGTGPASQFAGTVRYSPVQDYYRDGQVLDMTEALSLDGVAHWDPALTAELLNVSPTLSMALDGNRLVTVRRVEDPYSQFADNREAASVARELDYLARSARPEYGSYGGDLLSYMDFHSSATSAGRALDSLVPRLFGTGMTATLNHQQATNQQMLGQMTIRPVRGTRIAGTTGSASLVLEEDMEQGLFAFATALGGGGRQSDRGYRTPGYSFWQTGTVLGIEKRAGDHLLGLHLQAGFMRLDGSGNSGGTWRDTSLSLGVHGRFNPVSWNGGYVFGMARGGVDIIKQEREVVIGTYRGVNESDWTGFTGSAVAGGGYDFAIGCSRLGPVAMVEYSAAHRPDVTEEGALGRLRVDSGWYDSLRSGLGLSLSGDFSDRVGYNASAMWHHEFLSKTGTTRAGFAGYGGGGIVAVTRAAGRDSLGVSVGLKVRLSERSQLSIDGGGEFFRKGYASGWGGLSYSCSF